MRAEITILGNDICCRQDTTGVGEEMRIALSSDTLTQLQTWAKQYERAVTTNDQPLLLGLGTELCTWLNSTGWASGWVRGLGDRILEIAVDNPSSDAAAALLDVPWEVLVYDNDFLAADEQQTFIMYRSIARRPQAVPVAVTYRDLAIMFMAAAPDGQRELNFEDEEAAIIKATESLPVQLVVEESGCLDFLRDRLAQDGPFEAVHFSCHGDLSHNHGPVLALETPEGTLAITTPGEVANALGERKAPLVFLSACRTAEALVEKSKQQQRPAVEPFVRALIRAGVANVLGWDGSVHDADAVRFAQTFYHELGEFGSVPYAAGVARRTVLHEHRLNPQHGQHWHLARVYTGEHGGGPLCDRSKPKRKLRKAAGYREFLDKARARVPIASAQEFVGRRRQAQAVLAAFRKAEKAGVLLYGMGQIGKSSRQPASPTACRSMRRW